MADDNNRARRDSGETLVEVLCTMVILGIAIAALLAGLSTTVLSSSRHRDTATANTLLRSYAEGLKQVTRTNYIDCYASYPVPETAYSLPSGWAIPTNQTVNPCPGGPLSDVGTQQVTVNVVTPRGVTKTLDIWVRKS